MSVVNLGTINCKQEDECQKNQCEQQCNSVKINCSLGNSWHDISQQLLMAWHGPSSLIVKSYVSFLIRLKDRKCRANRLSVKVLQKIFFSCSSKWANEMRHCFGPPQTQCRCRDTYYFHFTGLCIYQLTAQVPWMQIINQWWWVRWDIFILFWTPCECEIGLVLTKIVEENASGAENAKREEQPRGNGSQSDKWMWESWWLFW